jgi:hypothetical protein
MSRGVRLRLQLRVVLTTRTWLGVYVRACMYVCGVGFKGCITGGHTVWVCRCSNINEGAIPTKRFYPWDSIGDSNINVLIFCSVSECQY